MSAAEFQAEYWMGFARGVAKAVKRPPTYSVEDWEAEAYLGLAKALKELQDKGGSVVQAHLGRSIRDHLFHDCTMRAYGMGSTKDHVRRPEFSRVACQARTGSMDEEAPGDNEGEPFTRHDVVADPMAADPLEEAAGALLRRHLDEWAATAPPALAQALEHLLEGRESASEVARELGVTTWAVQGARTRMRASVRLFLEERGYTCP